MKEIIKFDVQSKSIQLKIEFEPVSLQTQIPLNVLTKV